MKSKTLESQDALERNQKVFMEPNGVFEWQRIGNDVKCHCGHKQNSHLDNADICLNGLCISEKFGVDKKVEVVISPKAITRKNFPEKFTAHFNRN